MSDLQNAKVSEAEEKSNAFAWKFFLIVTVSVAAFSGAVIMFVF